MGKKISTDESILRLIEKNPDITEDELASKTGLEIDEVKNKIQHLSDTRVKILIIDDDKDAIVPLKMSMESANFNVLETYSGHEGLEKARSEIPDLILLDLMLPDMDGFEVCKTLKNDPHTKSIRIIMLTGKDAISSKIEGLENGADDYITKPFYLNELKARIKTVLRR
jgi:two-component system alkaline phosphatase synthesis response regulator PhoP